MNRICQLLNIKYPIIQGGMIWCSGWELAAAVSNSGGLGLLGAGSMNPDILRDQIRKCKSTTQNPFGINMPLLYPHAEEFVKIAIEEQVKVVFTSAGNPSKFTKCLKDSGITVIHVIANVKFAKKCEEAGVDAIVAEGFEAGGHNGKEETTTQVLVPLVKSNVTIPVIAAGGISSGRAMLAAFALGAEGVQIGSRFVASTESSAHDKFKQLICQARDGDTMLSLKKLVSVRLLKNKFYSEIEKLENAGATVEELSKLLGKGRAKLGMFEGNTEEGELEIGQVAALIQEVKPSAEIISEIIAEFKEAQKEISNFTL
jgi:enoyl-[acyl-carrier protein] reductase II